MEIEDPSLYKRLQYAKEVLVQMMSAEDLKGMEKNTNELQTLTSDPRKSFKSVSSNPSCNPKVIVNRNSSQYNNCLMSPALTKTKMTVDFGRNRATLASYKTGTSS